MTGKKTPPTVENPVEEDQEAFGYDFGFDAEARDEAAQAYRNQLADHARKKARRGTEALVEAASAGLLAGALRLSEPVSDFLREAGDGLLSFLNDEEEDG